MGSYCNTNVFSLPFINFFIIYVFKFFQTEVKAIEPSLNNSKKLGNEKSPATTTTTKAETETKDEQPSAASSDKQKENETIVEETKNSSKEVAEKTDSESASKVKSVKSE